ncbi:hypothetical protein [Streptomyces nanshensis]|uniref:hypothetical protein n=1 Tax=Streptomyces nanshensis TaxID=518642 RepID=UPI00114C8F00|nr:hypothetical protein [Streptomyces nanshensis]
MSVVGVLVLVAGGGTVINTVMNKTQQVSNSEAFGPSMWRNVPADKVFPKTLSTKLKPTDTADNPRHGSWRRLGIARPATCRDGLGGRLATEAAKRGCRNVLRATYVDPTGQTVSTVAVIVISPSDNAEAELGRFLNTDKRGDGVHAYAVPGTPAAEWSDERRIGGGGRQATGLNLPYGLAAVAGNVDGRMAGHLPEEWDIGDPSQPRPWQGAAKDLASSLDLYLSDLINKESK